MIGLMKKDFLLIKNNKNIILIAFLMVILFGVFGEMDISYILPFMLLTVYMSSFSYDEYNNFNAYVCTLPNGRENVVKAKYILTIMLTIFISIIAFFITLLTTKLDIKEILSSLTGSIFALTIVVSILYPLLFKYGSEKGRIILLVGVLAISGIGVLLMNNVKIDSTSNLIKFLDTYGLPIIAIVPAVSLIMSYNISKKIYLNKEF